MERACSRQELPPLSEWRVIRPEERVGASPSAVSWDHCPSGRLYVRKLRGSRISYNPLRVYRPPKGFKRFRHPRNVTQSRERFACENRCLVTGSMRGGSDILCERLSPRGNLRSEPCRLRQGERSLWRAGCRVCGPSITHQSLTWLDHPAPTATAKYNAR